MAKMKKEEIDKIIKRDMPGHRMVKKAKPQGGADARPSAVPTEAGTPDLQQLRQKYQKSTNPHGVNAATRKSNYNPGDNNPASDDDEIVAVEPENPTDTWGRNLRRKTVVISGREKKIVGKQG